MFNPAEVQSTNRTNTIPSLYERHESNTVKGIRKSDDAFEQGAGHLLLEQIPEQSKEEMDNSPSEQSPNSFLLNEELCKRQADHIQPYLKTESRNEERVISEVHTEEQSDITRVSGDPNLL